MNQLEETGSAYGVWDAATGGVIASDAVLSQWLAGRTCHELLPDFDFLLAGRFARGQTRLCRAEGEEILATILIKPLQSESKNWYLLRIQVTPERAGHGKYLDAVTGLPDRRALEPHRMKWQRDSLSQHVPHVLLFMDLDNFKQINDLHGHATGDKVLAVLARRWQKSLRGCDLIVRYGGDEFVVLLAAVRCEKEAWPVIQRLKQATSEPIPLDGQRLTVSATIGLAIADDTTAMLEELVAVADKSMYAAKRVTKQA